MLWQFSKLFTSNIWDLFENHGQGTQCAKMGGVIGLKISKMSQYNFSQIYTSNFFGLQKFIFVFQKTDWNLTVHKNLQKFKIGLCQSCFSGMKYVSLSQLFTATVQPLRP